MQVEIWSDVVCPWCYLGKRRFEQALAGFEHRDDVQVDLPVVRAGPGRAAGATTPDSRAAGDKYGMSPAQASQAQRQMEERAAGDGLTFRMEGLRSGNTRDAHRLIQLAKERGRQEALVERLHTRLLHRAGLGLRPRGADPARRRGRAGRRRGRQRCWPATPTANTSTPTRQWRSALGATGVPLFVIDRKYGISGAQPADTISGCWSAPGPRPGPAGARRDERASFWFATTHGSAASPK